MTPDQMRRMRLRRMNLLMAYASFASTKAAAEAAFTPLDLFAAGEQGVWYDPSDLSTMFQDAAGTTPVTAVEQPVGLRLDKSRGLVYGAELLTNPGPFSATTGWTGSANAVLSASSSRLVCTYASTDTFYQAVTVEAGKWYFAVASMKRDSGGGTAYMNFRNGTTLAAGVVGNWTATGTTSASDVRMGASYYAATSGTIYLHFPCSTSGSTVVSLASISVRELPGSHAFQTTDINRPVLSSRVNLLTRTEDFANAAWSKDSLLAFGSGSTVNATTAPNGAATADLITAANATAAAGVGQSVTMVAAAHTWSICFKPNGVRYVQLLWSTSASTNYANFDLVSGVVTAGTYTSATITAEANGFYRLSITSTISAGTYAAFAWFVDSGTAARAASFTGDGIKGAYVWGADLRVSNDGVGLPAYQRVTTATDYDTTGFPLYLRYNGTNSTMQTAAIDFSSTDKMAVFAGVRKLSDAAAGMVVELSASLSSNEGTFYITAPETIGAGGNFAWKSRGSVNPLVPVLSGTLLAPNTSVLTGLGDISGDRATLRVNGAQVGQSIADQGTGNYGNYALYLGTRAGSSVWFNGRDYGLCVLGRTATAAEIANMESWLNGKTGAF